MKSAFLMATAVAALPAPTNTPECLQVQYQHQPFFEGDMIGVRFKQTTNLPINVVDVHINMQGDQTERNYRMQEHGALFKSSVKLSTIAADLKQKGLTLEQQLQHWQQQQPHSLDYSFTYILAGTPVTQCNSMHYVMSLPEIIKDKLGLYQLQHEVIHQGARQPQQSSWQQTGVWPQTTDRAPQQSQQQLANIFDYIKSQSEISGGDSTMLVNLQQYLQGLTQISQVNQQKLDMIYQSQQQKLDTLLQILGNLVQQQNLGGQSTIIDRNNVFRGTSKDAFRSSMADKRTIADKRAELITAGRSVGRSGRFAGQSARYGN